MRHFIIAKYSLKIYAPVEWRDSFSEYVIAMMDKIPLDKAIESYTKKLLEANGINCENVNIEVTE